MFSLMAWFNMELYEMKTTGENQEIAAIFLDKLHD